MFKTSELAKEVEQKAEGWFAARSLGNPNMQKLLKEAKTDWQWQPTLVEVDGKEVKAHTGIHLAVKMIRGLGLRRTWQIGQLINQLAVSSQVTNTGRRKFFQQSGAFLVSVLFWPANKSLAPKTSTNTVPIVDSVPLESQEKITLVKKAIESPELQIIGSAYNLNFDIQSATALRNTLADNRQELVVRFNIPSSDFVRYLERSGGYVQRKGGYYRNNPDGGYFLTSLVINGKSQELPEGGVSVMSFECSDPTCGWEQRSSCEPCGSYVKPCEGWCCVCYDPWGGESIIGCDWEWCGSCGSFC